MKKSLYRPGIWRHIKPYVKIETLAVSLAGILICMIMGYLFYDTWIGGICLSPGAVLLCHFYSRWKERRKKKQTLLEFKELLYTLSANLKTGYSVENAWLGARKDMSLLYPQESRIMNELDIIASQLHLNVPIEKAVNAFAERTGLEEIQSFAEVLSTAKRSGGNLVHMMDKTANIIAEKIEVEQEIQTILSGKQMEQRIMCGMPVLMLLYLKLTNPEYLDNMYHNWFGIIVMTFCIIGTGIAAYWGSRIVGIEV